MTTIHNGIVDTPCCSMLITTTYKEGGGDRGCTAHTPTTRATKADNHLMRLYGRLSRFQVAIKETIPYFWDADTKVHLEWVWSNVRSMSSLAYLEGATTKHAFTTKPLTYMERVIALRKGEMGGSPSFIQWEHPDILRMEYLWCEVRDTEEFYRDWYAEADVCETVAHNTDTLAVILNRLSSYLWWCMRWENRVRDCPERVWQGYVTPYPLGDS